MNTRTRIQKPPRVVESNQDGIHERLAEVVQRHQDNLWQQPIRLHNQQAFAAIRQELESGQFIIDAGCGTGRSSIALANQYPDQLVLGIDRSDNRLERRKAAIPNNVRFIRADLEDWWRLTNKAGLVASRQTIYYPNPYPKAAQLQRRWHAHPVLGDLIKCSPTVEIRSNWKTYLNEAEVAFLQYCPSAKVSELSEPEGDAMTAFEQKYRESGQKLYQLVIEGLVAC